MKNKNHFGWLYFLPTLKVIVFFSLALIVGKLIVSFPVFSSYVYSDVSIGVPSILIVSFTNLIKSGFKISVITGDV